MDLRARIIAKVRKLSDLNDQRKEEYVGSGGSDTTFLEGKEAAFEEVLETLKKIKP